MWSIAYKTLLSDRGKFLTALVGVIFAVALVNVQGGLFYGLLQKSSLLIDNSEDVDIWVGHRQMNNVDFGGLIPTHWNNRIRSIPGVKFSSPYLVDYCRMTLPDGRYELVLLIGCDPATRLGNVRSTLSGHPDSVLKPDGVIVDQCDGDRMGYPHVGDIVELAGKRARIVDFSHGLVGFVVSPFCFTTIDRARRFLDRSDDTCTYLLVESENAADIKSVQHLIQQRIPDAAVYTASEFRRKSFNFWLTRTGLGISFGAATLLGLFVGMIIVAQTLYTIVLDRLQDFGTLKAIGAKEWQLQFVLLAQAMIMAIIGSVIGITLVCVLQQAFSTPRAPIVIPFWLSWGSCVLVVGICLAASLLPYRKVQRVDPLMVLQQ